MDCGDGGPGSEGVEKGPNILIEGTVQGRTTITREVPEEFFRRPYWDNFTFVV